MLCPFCGWVAEYGGTSDPCEVVIAFDDHLDEHVIEMMHESTG